MNATLTATDRCDRCGVRAHVEVTFHGSPLLFCGHHWRESAEKITALGATITRNDLGRLVSE